VRYRRGGKRRGRGRYLWEQIIVSTNIVWCLRSCHLRRFESKLKRFLGRWGRSLVVVLSVLGNFMH
jgi:hypothetical protein